MMFAFKNYIYRPLFGYGIGNFSAIVSSQPQFAKHEVVVAHNTWIDFLVDGGLIGFVLLFTLFYENLKCLLNRKFAAIWSLLALWGFASFIVGGERTFFFWNSLILLSILSQYFSKNNFNIKKLMN